MTFAGGGTALAGPGHENLAAIGADRHVIAVVVAADGAVVAAEPQPCPVAALYAIVT
jgi:hypothetical protein